MELKEIVAPTMKELFIQEIERKILSGELKIGEKLPTEREMERFMKVSKTIINSGLAELARNGFVEIVPRKGVYVKDYMRYGQLNTLASIMNFRGGRLDTKTFHSLTEYRIQTDCECAYQAALHRTPEDIRLLLSIHNKVSIAKDVSTIAKLKFEFEHALYCATGNCIYPLVSNSFKKLSLLFGEIIFGQDTCEDPSLYILDLIQAIEDKKADLAKELMRKLLVTRIEELKKGYYAL